MTPSRLVPSLAVLVLAMAALVPGARASSSLSTAEQLAIAAIVLGSIAIVALIILLIMYVLGCGLYKHHHVHHDKHMEYVDAQGRVVSDPMEQPLTGVAPLRATKSMNNYARNQVDLI